MIPFRIVLISMALLAFASQAYSAAPISKWVSLDSDLKDRIKRIIQSEVENRDAFSAQEDEILNTRVVEEERQKDNAAYKAAIDSANREFARSRKRRDDLTAQYQAAAYDFEEFQKNVKTMRGGIENIDNQIVRYEQDIKVQQESLKKWLQTEKQGEAMVAVIYTRGFKDKEHDLESLADQASAALMAQHMGTYIQSFSRVIDNVLSIDFIRAIEEGTAKWNQEEPLRIELEKGNRGTTYLRIKRYELYPFQAPKTGRSRPSAEARKLRAIVLTSTKDLDTFLSQSHYTPANYELRRADSMIQETAQNNSQAEEGLREQVQSFRERIIALQEKITGARSDRDPQVAQLPKKEAQLAKLQADLDLLKGRRDSAEKALHDSQTVLHEIKRTHEAIIIKTSLATTRGSQTPAEASAEAVIDKLEEVRNDARTQHSSSTTDVMNFQVVGETSSQAVTEARIIGVRLISLINQGDSVLVKMAFRVRTELEERTKEPSPRPATTAPAPKPAPKQQVATIEPLPAAPRSPEEKPPAPEPARPVAPKRNTAAIASAETDDFLFELTSVKMAGGELTFLIDATNKTDRAKYLALYDQASRYTKSTLIDETGNTHEVKQVYLWEGERKTSAYDAHRGIPVESKQSVTAEMIFKEIPPATRVIKLLNLHPYTAIRILFFKWNDTDLPLKDIRVRR
jgi:predicted  nucleic acid-binding Zn-ribbon protein